ncbi:Conserved_hypothetical protein [Hexamita inflata]|uniref:Uncharacterized protein n=1 Tax=Hexamita inflata TaxID=28002 RepID=A0ABP1IST0_9EUKA
MIVIHIFMLEQKSFKQCFSPASTIVGNRLTKTISLHLIPNPLMSFIPSDNMCKVLNRKSSTAFILLNSQALGLIRLPGTATGIAFTYIFNQNITISYTFATIPLYDQTLDATNGGFEILMDGEYQILGSVANVVHTRSNQTSCFSQARFVFDLAIGIYGFEVEPVFCSLTSFDVFFEFYVNHTWLKIPVRAISSSNPLYISGDYSDINTDFLQITRYLLDPTSASEYAKYTDDERLAVQMMVGAMFSDFTLQVRLSLEYDIKSTIGAITAVADYWYSLDSLSCSSDMVLKATLNEGNIMFKTGFVNQLPCLEVPSSSPFFEFEQYLKQNIVMASVAILVQGANKTVRTFTRMIPFFEFISLPYVKFTLEEGELIDETARVLMFIGFYDQADSYLYDFTTPYIPLQRTCVQKRVVHFKKEQTVFALWTKNESRCTARTGQTALSYYGKTFNGVHFEHKLTFQVSAFVNYSAVQDVAASCNDKQCEINREHMMSRKNRASMYFVEESELEYNEIRYYAIDTFAAAFKWSVLIFGLTSAAIVIFVSVGLIISH